MIIPNITKGIVDVSVLDGWKQVFTSGTVYYEFWDEGVFVIRCTMQARDNILELASLPLKRIDSGITGILTDF